MRNSATSFSRSGLSDWLIQRVSAYILGAYFLFIVGYLLCTKDVYFSDWYALMSSTGMRIFTLLAILSLAAHAWVGLWTVFTDYITERQMGPKAAVIRLVFQTGMALFVFVYVVWGIQILWGN
ncbi:MAG: succinate dehydrogenase, hydrophobic membrane anchor protein [Pedobacter sp.]|nr:succinate dehydrogenase, hydrophobic membrane anchor protein [Pedobacter sp.]